MGQLCVPLLNPVRMCVFIKQHQFKHNLIQLRVVIPVENNYIRNEVETLMLTTFPRLSHETRLITETMTHRHSDHIIR